MNGHDTLEHADASRLVETSLNRSPTATPAPTAEDDARTIGLVDYLLLVWDRKWLLAGCLAGGIILAVAYLLVATPVYTAAMVVKPVDRSSGFGPGAVFGRLRAAGLTALDGISLDTLGQKVTPYDEFLTLITSHRVARRIHDEHDVLPKILHRQWDSESKTWIKPEGVIFAVKEWLKRILGRPAWSPPNADTLSRYIEDSVKVGYMGTTAMRRISFSFPDRRFAEWFLQALYDTAERELRTAARANATAVLAQAQDKLRTIEDMKHRAIIYDLIGDLERQALFLADDITFSAELVEPPVSDPRPTSPKPFTVLAFGIVLGLLAGVLLTIILELRAGTATLPRGGDASRR